MKIIVYASGFPTLSQTFVDKQINSLVNNGCEVTIVREKKSNSQSLVNNKISVVSLSPWVNNKFFKYCYYFYFCVLCVLRFKFRSVILIIKDKLLSLEQKLSVLNALVKGVKIKSDLVLVHFGNNGYYVSKLREHGVIDGKIGVIFHGYEISRRSVFKKNYEAYLSSFKSCDYFFPVSKLWSEKLTGMGCPNSKIFVSRMGIDFEEFKYNPIYKVNDVFRLIQVGRLTDKKGILDTIHAISHLSSSCKVHLTIVGGGELEDKLINEIKLLGLEGKVSLNGPLPNKLVKDLLYKSNCYILPSKVADDGDMEGVPVAIMEAMAAGVPVISTYHSGIPELVEDGISGFLVAEGDVINLARKIEMVSNLSLDSINAITIKAREKVELHFNNDIEAKRLIKFIESDFVKSNK